MKYIKQDIIKVGKAILKLGLQNSHSGNISVRIDNDIYITKTGSMKGHLSETDIVGPGLYEPKSGLFQASSETGTHQKILEYAGSTVHAHSMAATLLSYVTEVVEPMDYLGKKVLGEVAVLEFEYPVGSREMEVKIPEILKTHPAMIIKTHGPMTKGANVFEAFFNMNICDYSCEILLNLTKLKISLHAFPVMKYPDFDGYRVSAGKKDTEDKELIRLFKTVASDMFNMQLSPFHTGSISVQDGKEMLFSPSAAMPDDFDSEIVKINITDDNNKDYFHRLHQAVYRYSHCQAAVFTHSPQAIIQGFRSLSVREDRIIPIDAEGGYLYPAVPIVLPDENMETIIKKAERYKMVLIAGIGVLAIGHTPTHCLHHNSSIKSICYMKTQLEMMEKTGVVVGISRFLDKRGKQW